MSMILHLFKTDVRHSRVLLAVWLLLVLLQCALIGAGVHAGDRLWQAVYASISVMVPVFQMLVLVVVVPQLVLEEPLVGTTAFWFTRPIPRPALLQAKALFAAMLITLPLLAELAVLAAGGVTAHDIGLAVPEIILNQLALIVTVAGVAVFTRSFGRFAIAGVILIVAMIMASIGIYWVRLLLHPATALSSMQNVSLLKSRGLVQSLFVVLGGGIVITHQYLTRRTARSLAGAVVVVVGSVAIGGFWPWDYFAAPPLPTVVRDFDPTAAKITLVRTMTRDLTTIRGAEAPQKNLDATLDVTGLPAGYVATSQKARVQLSLPDGQPLVVLEPGRSYYGSQPNADALEFALGGIPVANAGFPNPPTTSLLAVEANVYGRYAGEPLRLTADLDFIASHYVVVAEMPLVRGSRYDHESEHVIITDVLRQGDGVEVVLEQRKVNLLFSPAANADGEPGVAALSGRNNTVYLLRNKRRHEAVLVKQNIGLEIGDFFSVGGRRLVRRTIRLPFGPEQFNLTPDLNDAWLADAELVRLQLVPVAAFSKPLVVDKFKLSGPNAAVHRAAVSSVAAPASFAHIVLPENATPAQVRDYVNSILIASQHRASFRPDDPQVGMLVKVGPQHLGILLEAADRLVIGPRLYLDEAIAQVAGPESKAQILQALTAHPALIAQVVKYNWKAEAHDILLAGLRDEQQRSLPKEWIQAVASFEEPATYPDLKAYLVRCLNRQATFNAIRKLPGIDLAATVEAAWAKARHGNLYEPVDASAMAITFGYPDALETLVKVLRDKENDAGKKRAATLIKRHTSATGDDAALVAWFDANRDQLTFDHNIEKFVPSAKSATPAPTH